LLALTTALISTTAVGQTRRQIHHKVLHAGNGAPGVNGGVGAAGAPAGTPAGTTPPPGVTQLPGSPGTATKGTAGSEGSAGQPGPYVGTEANGLWTARSGNFQTPPSGCLCTLPGETPAGSSGAAGTNGLPGTGGAGGSATIPGIAGNGGEGLAGTGGAGGNVG
jgi:hypothetical protein